MNCNQGTYDKLHYFIDQFEADKKSLISVLSILFPMKMKSNQTLLSGKMKSMEAIPAEIPVVSDCRGIIWQRLNRTSDYLGILDS